TRSIVLVRVEPPAPQVTDTNPGSSRFRSAMVRYSGAYPASVLGGKNSKEITGRERAHSSARRMKGFYPGDACRAHGRAGPVGAAGVGPGWRSWLPAAA